MKIKKYFNFNIQGSALIIALSVVGVLALTGTLMIEKYLQNVKKVQTANAKVGMNELFNHIEQSLRSQANCSSAFQNYVFTNVVTGGTPPTWPIPSLTAMVASVPYSIAIPGMVSNGVSIANSTAPDPAISLTGGLEYTNFGTQNTGLTSYQGLNCALANLHIIASKERMSGVGTARRTVGTEKITEDLPITVFTDPATQKIKTCFAGKPLPGTCIQAALATMDTITPLTQCAPPGTINFNWTATNASYVQINCASPIIMSGNLTSSPSSIDMSTVPLGTIETCTATAYNSAFVPSVISIPVVVHVEASCIPPAVTITTSKSCVNPGQTFTISWTDNDLDPLGLETITGFGAPAPFAPPVSPGGSITPTAAAAGTLNYSIVDTNYAGSGSATTSLNVIPAPIFSTALSASPIQVFSGQNITFAYASLNATGASYVDPVTSITTSAALNGPVVVPAPSPGGSYSYTYTLAGGCPSDPPVTNSSSVTVCVCVPANVAATPSGNPSIDSCGISRPECPGTLTAATPTASPSITPTPTATPTPTPAVPSTPTPTPVVTPTPSACLLTGVSCGYIQFDSTFGFPPIFGTGPVTVPAATCVITHPSMQYDMSGCLSCCSGWKKSYQYGGGSCYEFFYVCQ